MTKQTSRCCRQGQVGAGPHKQTLFESSMHFNCPSARLRGRWGGGGHWLTLALLTPTSWKFVCVDLYMDVHVDVLGEDALWINRQVD